MEFQDIIRLTQTSQDEIAAAERAALEDQEDLFGNDRMDTLTLDTKLTAPKIGELSEKGLDWSEDNALQNSHIYQITAPVDSGHINTYRVQDIIDAIALDRFTGSNSLLNSFMDQGDTMVRQYITENVFSRDYLALDRKFSHIFGVPVDHMDKIYDASDGTPIATLSTLERVKKMIDKKPSYSIRANEFMEVFGLSSHDAKRVIEKYSIDFKPDNRRIRIDERFWQYASDFVESKGLPDFYNQSEVLTFEQASSVMLGRAIPEKEARDRAFTYMVGSDVVGLGEIIRKDQTFAIRDIDKVKRDIDPNSLKRTAMMYARQR